MATRLSPLGIIAKWFLVPGLLAATGYFFIGPRVGDKVIPKNVKDRLPAVAGTPGTQAVQNENGTSGDTESTPKTFAAPQVDVQVSPIGNATKPKKKRHRRKKKPSTTATAPGTPTPPTTMGPPDTGGADGTAPPPVGHDG